MMEVNKKKRKKKKSDGSCTVLYTHPSYVSHFFKLFTFVISDILPTVATR